MIVDLYPTDSAHIEAISEMLVTGFAEVAPRYVPTLVEARAVVHESFGPETISRILLTEQGDVGGFIGGKHAYGSVWDLHPLVVAPRHQRCGYGRRLVLDLVHQVAARGALTLFVSTSDEANATSLFGLDLYADPLTALHQLRSTRPHAIDFYRKLGFTLVGLLPDAEGHGMPSIHFAKRVGPKR